MEKQIKMYDTFRTLTLKLRKLFFYLQQYYFISQEKSIKFTVFSYNTDNILQIRLLSYHHLTLIVCYDTLCSVLAIWNLNFSFYMLTFQEKKYSTIIFSQRKSEFNSSFQFIVNLTFLINKHCVRLDGFELDFDIF